MPVASGGHVAAGKDVIPGAVTRREKPLSGLRLQTAESLQRRLELAVARLNASQRRCTGVTLSLATASGEENTTTIKSCTVLPCSHSAWPALSRNVKS